MTSVNSVVAVFTTALISSTVAVEKCDMGIVEKLKEVPQCYTDGIPKLTSSGKLGTHVRISKGELPADTKCVTAIAREGGADVTLYRENQKPFPYSVKQELQGDYLSETGEIFPKGAKYRLYVIHNEANVYSYYRCTEDEIGTTGTGPMGDVAVGCDYTTDDAALAVIDKAMECFNKIGITNIEKLDPCDCSTPKA